MKKIDYCHCGLPLHYSDDNQQRWIERVITRYGAFMDVLIDGNKTYRIQRHYIALHGIRNKNINRLGFIEVVK